jgi:hypothetical protein
MWISVKDRLPKHDSRVDAWHREHGRLADCLCSHLSGEDGLARWYPANSGGRFGASVTHWMPAPAPPEEFRDGKNRGLE